MQLGVNSLEGSKPDVLADIKRQVESEKVRFKKLCEENLVNIGQTPPDKHGVFGYLHEPTPIEDTTSALLLDTVLKHAQEQLAHVPDELGEDDENKVSVSFNITIHRPNPK